LFTFFGAFTDRNPSVADKFLERWPDVDIVEIDRPFRGLAIRFQESVYDPAEEDLPELVSAGVQDISRQIPSVRFVLLRTECWGGICVNKGQFILDGALIVNEPGVPIKDINNPKPDGVLRRLIGHFDVDIGPSEIFEPLSRGFPWDSGNVEVI
jgi:hypothetical protein